MILYSVVHKDCINTASIFLMGENRTQAIKLWELWNQNVKFTQVAKKERWTVKKYKVSLIKR